MSNGKQLFYIVNYSQLALMVQNCLKCFSCSKMLQLLCLKKSQNLIFQVSYFLEEQYNQKLIIFMYSETEIVITMKFVFPFVSQCGSHIFNVTSIIFVFCLVEKFTFPRRIQTARCIFSMRCSEYSLDRIFQSSCLWTI